MEEVVLMEKKEESIQWRQELRREKKETGREGVVMRESWRQKEGDSERQ